MSALKQYVVYTIKYNNDIIYIGSTYNIRNRKIDHKSVCYNEDSKQYNFKLYKRIRENNIDFKELKFEIVEKVENKFSSDNENKKEARKREEHYRKKYIEITGGNITNMIRACRTDEEIKEQMKATKKKYYENNKEELNANQKKYNENNKEDRKAYHKKYYENNRAKILERQSQRYDCKCGSTNITIGHKAEHERTQKHIDFISQNKSEISDEESD